jgi:hypothetical protein
MKYRKKPVIIDAWQFDPWSPPGHVPAWINFTWFSEEVELDANGKECRGRKLMSIPTLEGTMTANVGDWIIKGINGEVYPCKPDIFEATYEPVLTA